MIILGILILSRHMIKRIRVSNFKSFGELDLPLENFNVVVGANASGKSNLISILKFLRDIAKDGLENAIAMQGGIGYVRNILLDVCAPAVVEVDYQVGSPLGYAVAGKPHFVQIESEVHSFNATNVKEHFELEPLANRDEYRVREETIEVFGQLAGQQWKATREASFKFVRKNGKLELHTSPQMNLPEIEQHLSHPVLPFALLKDINLPETMLYSSFVAFLLNPMGRSPLADLRIYEIDSKRIKGAARFTGKQNLDEDGANLAQVLDDLKRDERRYRKFCNIVQSVLEFVSDFQVERVADRSLLLKVKETFGGEEYIPSFLMSDGTIGIVALIVALYFEKNEIVVIEEPERNIHPQLIARVVQMMKEASANKQVIITTHSPEVVKHASLENLIFVARDKDGCSIAFRPRDRQAVQVFLEKDLGVEDIFVQNLFGV